MPATPVEDETLASLEIQVPGPVFLTGFAPGAKTMSVPLALRAMGSIGGYDELRVIASVTANEGVAATDHQSFAFQDDGTVMVFDDDDIPDSDRHVVVSASGFRRLVARLITAVVAATPSLAPEVMDEEWWPTLLADLERISEAAGSAGPGRS